MTLRRSGRCWLRLSLIWLTIAAVQLDAVANDRRAEAGGDRFGALKRRVVKALGWSEWSSPRDATVSASLALKDAAVNDLRCIRDNAAPKVGLAVEGNARADLQVYGGQPTSSGQTPLGFDLTIAAGTVKMQNVLPLVNRVCGKNALKLNFVEKRILKAAGGNPDVQLHKMQVGFAREKGQPVAKVTFDVTAMGLKKRFSHTLAAAQLDPQFISGLAGLISNPGNVEARYQVNQGKQQTVTCQVSAAGAAGCTVDLNGQRFELAELASSLNHWLGQR